MSAYALSWWLFIPVFIARVCYRYVQIERVRDALAKAGRNDARTVRISIDYLMRWSSFPEAEPVYSSAHRRNMLAQFAFMFWFAFTALGGLARTLESLFGL